MLPRLGNWEVGNSVLCVLLGDDDLRCQPWIFRDQGGILTVDENLGVREDFRLLFFEAGFVVE